MIGLIDQPIGVVATRAEAPAVRWLGSRSLSRYLADPFGVPGTRDRIYCESFSASDGSGAIEELRIDADAIEEQTPVALPIPGHLSYPYLFQHEGVLHCVPESVATRQTRILRSEANGAWSTLTVALPRVAAADPTLFWWRDRFWLAYTDADRGGFDNLNLAFSERLAGPWFPHPNNPVKVDAASSRPAGTPFLHEGALYRPAQDCSVTYGGGIAVNRVSVCSPTAFCEETVRVLRPSTDDLNPDGWHTLSAWGDRTLIDGKRYTVNPFVLRRKVRRRLARLGSGLARGLSW